MTPRTLGALLHLSYLRSAFLVGATLAEQFPTDDKYEAFLNDPAVQEWLEKFYALMDKIREELADPTVVTSSQYQDALAPLLDLSEKWNISAPDLLNVLIQS